MNMKVITILNPASVVLEQKAFQKNFDCVQAASDICDTFPNLTQTSIEFVDNNNGVVVSKESGKVLLHIQITELPLSPELLEEAYREQLNNYRTTDAEYQLYDYLGYNIDEDADNSKCLASFMQTHGFTLEDAVNPESEHYILDEILNVYENSLDCNLAENDLWQEAVSDVLNEIKKAIAS